MAFVGVLVRPVRDAVATLVPARVRARLLPASNLGVVFNWDREYASGYGRFLASRAELPRYSMIAGYCKELGGTSVLDVGCGTGILHRHLAPFGYSNYVGVDLSSVAIDQARREATGGAQFEVAPAKAYRSDQRFDVIVFNEILYLLDDAPSLICQYQTLLKDDGVFLVSMFEQTRSWQVWFRCAELLELLDEVVVQHVDDAQARRSRQLRWRVRLCRPHLHDAGT